MVTLPDRNQEETAGPSNGEVTNKPKIIFGSVYLCPDLKRLFVFLDLTFWKEPDSTGAPMASTHWPTSCFLRSWSPSTPTSLSTSERTPISPKEKLPSLWKQQRLSTNTVWATREAQASRTRHWEAKSLWRLIWLNLVQKQNLCIRRLQIKQHTTRQV